MVAAGRCWSTPLLEQRWALSHPEAPFWLALALVLLPPLLMALVLLARIRQPGPSAEAANPGRGESFD